MKREYLINLVEELCKENSLEISKVYEKMARIYQDTYGVNIVLEMGSTGEWDITRYLEVLGTIERYVSILNGLKKCIKEGWNLELDKL